MSLVVREMQLHAAQIKGRLRNPWNGVRDLGIDLKRKVIPIMNADKPQDVPVSALDVFGPKLVDLDEEAFGPVVLPLVKGYRIDEIQRAVSIKYQLPRIEMLSHRRTANIVRPRQVAMYLSKILTTKSLPEIGRRFGKKDHTTVLHAVRKIAAKRGVDAVLDAEIIDLIKIITA